MEIVFVLLILAPMDLNETISTISRWIKSCETNEQISLLEKATDQFFIPFKNLSGLELQLAKGRLKELFNVQKLLVIKPTETGVPTLDLNRNRFNEPKN